MSVFRSARLKLLSSQAPVKLSSPTQLPRQRAADGVGQAQVDRPAERHADDEDDVDDGRGDEERREHAAILERTPPATCAGFQPRSGLGLHRTGSILVDSG